MKKDRFITGIFNYCDYWCERCAFTRRCRNFSMGREMEREAVDAFARQGDCRFEGVSRIYLVRILLTLGDLDHPRLRVYVPLKSVEAVKLARSFVEDVEFSAEDAFRSDSGFLKDGVGAVIEAGASSGWALPMGDTASIVKG